MVLLNFLTIFLIMNVSTKTIETNFLLNSDIMKTSDRWRIVNDGVMGGLSSSNVSVKDDKIIFTGTVSIENNGGFASLRSPVKDYSFENFSGIEVKIKGDGKRYNISMKVTSYFTGYFYTTNFETKSKEWISIKLPFDMFKLYYFGREINSDIKISLDKIKEISFLIGDNQEGVFIVEIDYMKLY